MKRKETAKSKMQSQNKKRIKKGVSQWNIAWRRFKKNRAALAGALIVGFVIFLATFDALIAPYAPNETPGFRTGETRNPPSLKYLFGTDYIGKDVFSQVVYGSRSALFVGFASAGIAMSLAILVGLISGYYGGMIDNILMRVSEIFLVIPFLLILLVFLKVINVITPGGGGLSMVVLMIGLFSWAADARIIRGEVLRVKESTFIEASKSLGASKRRIVFRHIFPNVLHIIIVLTTLMIASAILVEAAISFLGFGDAAAITWGQQLQKANEAVKEAWWEGVFPGLFITLLVLGFSLLGNGLRDALDPRLRE
jgi:ABC-type dipeptide/oligopeptide/nickel transport system permease subunit